jgi:hypothetical protein
VHGTLTPHPDDRCISICKFHVTGRINYAELVLAIPVTSQSSLSATCVDTSPHFAVTRVGYYNYLPLLPRELWYGRDIYKTSLPRSCLQENGLMFYLEITIKSLDSSGCHPSFFRHISPWALVSGPIE